MIRPQDLLCPKTEGLYCAPGDFYIDPTRPVVRAVITHGHADHARAGHGAVLATPQTLDIMGERYGPEFARSMQAAAYGERVPRDEVEVTLVPAGHVLGSAQAVVRWKGLTMVVSGDYKRRRDPTCPPFEPVPCDVVISEATFGLPVFRHPDDKGEIARLLRSVAQFPERSHLIGAYALEYLMIGFATAIFGVIAGSVAAWLIVTRLMTLSFIWQAGSAAGVVAAALIVTVGLGLLGTLLALNQKPATVLRKL